MAGLGAKKFVDTEVLYAADVNGYLMEQSIMRFATTTARDNAFGGATELLLAEGMTCYIDNLNVLQIYTGSEWVSVVTTNSTAWGKVLEVGATAATAFAAATPLAVLSGAAPITAGRQYRVEAKIAVQVTGTAATGNTMYVTANSVTKGLWYQTTAIPQFFNVSCTGFDIYSASELGVTSGTSNVTFTLYWRCNASGALNTNPDALTAAGAYPQRLVVTDIGLA
jgi:hypothetical protein